MNKLLVVQTCGTTSLVGVLYYVLNVKSPAPPLVALVGLLGMVIGEQLLPFIKSYF
ncbi:DUF1427 family protein [Acinetobacter baumannii]